MERATCNLEAWSGEEAAARQALQRELVKQEELATEQGKLSGLIVP